MAALSPFFASFTSSRAMSCALVRPSVIVELSAPVRVLRGSPARQLPYAVGPQDSRSCLAGIAFQDRRFALSGKVGRLPSLAFSGSCSEEPTFLFA